MSEHTPGPWTIEYSETSVRWPTVIAINEPGHDDGSPIEVCEISESFAIDAPPDDPDRMVAEANARLIAAAPELFSALDKLIDVLSTGCPDDVTWADFAAALAAIAKVKGGAE